MTRDAAAFRHRATQACTYASRQGADRGHDVVASAVTRHEAPLLTVTAVIGLIVETAQSSTQKYL